MAKSIIKDWDIYGIEYSRCYNFTSRDGTQWNSNCTIDAVEAGCEHLCIALSKSSNEFYVYAFQNDHCSNFKWTSEKFYDIFLSLQAYKSYERTIHDDENSSICLYFISLYLDLFIFFFEMCAGNKTTFKKE